MPHKLTQCLQIPPGLLVAPPRRDPGPDPAEEKPGLGHPKDAQAARQDHARAVRVRVQAPFAAPDLLHAPPEAGGQLAQQEAGVTTKKN
jgi:hypothetical protein